VEFARSVFHLNDDIQVVIDAEFKLNVRQMVHPCVLFKQVSNCFILSICTLLQNDLLLEELYLFAKVQSLNLDKLVLCEVEN
jgi:hypothetical protein